MQKHSKFIGENLLHSNNERSSTYQSYFYFFFCTNCARSSNFSQVWEDEPHAQTILLKGCGGKAFCAGGDIRSLYDNGLKARQGDKKGKANWVNFFEDEYRLNFMTSQMMTPYIPFMNGITMGGGVGISVHSKFSMATENTLFAMPETGIGFFPDVGGSHFLSRLRKNVGFYLGLTGARLKGADVIHAGIAKHFAYSFDYNSLHSLLIDGHDKYSYTQRVVDYISVPVENLPAFTLQPHLETIDRCFSKETVEEIMQALREEKKDVEFAQEALKMMERASPLSLKIALKQIRNGASMDLIDCLKQEFRIAQNMLHNDDFYTGVKATLITKERNARPAWKHKSVEDVTDAEVDAFFQLPEEGRDLEVGPGVTVRGRGWRRLLNKKYQDPATWTELGLVNPAYGAADVMNRVSGYSEHTDDLNYFSQAAYWRFIFSSARFPGSTEYYEEENRKIRSLFGYLDDLSTRTTALNFHKNLRDSDIKKIAKNAIMTPDLRQALITADRDLSIRPMDFLLNVQDWKIGADPEVVEYYTLTPEVAKQYFNDVISSTTLPIDFVVLTFVSAAKKYIPGFVMSSDRENMILIAIAKAREMVTNKFAFPPPPVKTESGDLHLFSLETLASIDIDTYYSLLQNELSYDDVLSVGTDGLYVSTKLENNKMNKTGFNTTLKSVMESENMTREEILEKFMDWIDTPATSMNVSDILLPNISRSVATELIRLNKSGDFDLAPIASKARGDLHKLAVQQFKTVAIESRVPPELAADFAEWYVTRNTVDSSLGEMKNTIDIHANIVDHWLQELEYRSSAEIYDELKAEHDFPANEIIDEAVAKEQPLGYEVKVNKRGNTTSSKAIYPTIVDFPEFATHMFNNLKSDTRDLLSSTFVVPKTPEESEIRDNASFWAYIGAFKNFTSRPTLAVDIIPGEKYGAAQSQDTVTENDVGVRILPPAYVRRAAFAKKNNIPFQIPLRDD